MLQKIGVQIEKLDNLEKWLGQMQNYNGVWLEKKSSDVEIAGKFRVEKLAELQTLIAENLAKLAHAEQDLPEAQKKYIEVAKMVKVEINNVIIPSLKDAKEKMPQIYKNYKIDGAVDALFESGVQFRDTLRKAYAGYMKVKTTIEYVSVYLSFLKVNFNFS
jgi:hypothetical protein